MKIQTFLSLSLLTLNVALTGCQSPNSNIKRPYNTAKISVKNGTAYLTDTSSLKPNPVLPKDPPALKKELLEEPQNGSKEKPQPSPNSMLEGENQKQQNTLLNKRGERLMAKRGLINPSQQIPKIHYSKLEVSTSIPIPTAYSSPQIVGNSVVPSTPTRFTSVNVGTQITQTPNGTEFVSREFDGFINYGGQTRIIQPVFSTIKIKRE